MKDQTEINSPKRKEAAFLILKSLMDLFDPFDTPETIPCRIKLLPKKTGVFYDMKKRFRHRDNKKPY